jgi:hypothetical protein
MHRAAWPACLDQAALNPQGISYLGTRKTVYPQADRRLRGRHHLRMRAAHSADDLGGPRLLERRGQSMPLKTPGAYLRP